MSEEQVGSVHSSRVVAVVAHAIPERRPLKLAVGDAVVVGRRDDEWPAFVFVTAAQGAGWVPSRHLSAGVGDAVVVSPYDTTELATSPGDPLEVVARDDESGWLWCRSRDGREGWVPGHTLAPLPGDELQPQHPPRVLGTLGAAGGAGVIRIEERFEIGIDELWSALTDRERLARWYGEVEGELRAGGESTRASVRAVGKARAASRTAILHDGSASCPETPTSQTRRRWRSS